MGAGKAGTGNMKLTMNGSLTIGTDDGANIEMRESVTDAFWPFKFGASVNEVRNAHHPWEIYETSPILKKALDSLKDGTFSVNEDEKKAFLEIFQDLVEKDPYRLLLDFEDYYKTQKKVEQIFEKPLEWARLALHNVSGMGRFSVDVSIRKYAKEIWNINPLPPDPLIVAKVREEYSQHDRCLIGVPK